MRSAEGLAVHAEEVLAEQWLYAWGMFGQFLKDVYSDLANGSYYRLKNPSGLKELKAILDSGKNPRVCDCHGIVDGYLVEVGDFIPESSPLDTTANTDFYSVKASGVQGVDWGLISTLPQTNQRGLGVWRDGHFGICVGNNQVIDIYWTAHPARKALVSAGTWTHWLKCKNVDYGGGNTSMTLKIGVVGASVEVRQLQSDLNTIGSYGLVADGIFGAKTDAAVRDFQSKHGLTVDGIAGDKTLAAIAEAIKPPVIVAPPVIDYAGQLAEKVEKITFLTNEISAGQKRVAELTLQVDQLAATVSDANARADSATGELRTLAGIIKKYEV